MKPQGWITGWLEPWDQTLHGIKTTVLKDKCSGFANAMSAPSVLSVSSVVNPFTNKFSPGSPGEVRPNT
jgi:hypothetical protein